MGIRLLFTLLFLYVLHAGATTYYFSSSDGNDSRTSAEAQKPSTPWKSLAKLNAVFSALLPGDAVLFKRGDVFSGYINIIKSGTSVRPIRFGAYGNGKKPVISGFFTINNWTSGGTNVWEADVPDGKERVNLLLLNNEVKEIGRYPNKNASNKGYLTIDAFLENKEITDNELLSTLNWTGGEVVIRKNRSTIDRNLITQHSGATLRYITESFYWPAINFGYFIQNHPQTLDTEGEWYFASLAKKLGIYSNGKPAKDAVKISTINNLVSINNQQDLVFEEISFEGANENVFDIRNGRSIRISNCTIAFSGANAINAPTDVYGLTIENSSIENTNNVACSINNGTKVTIRNNRIRNTGTIEGMGKGNIGSYEAIMIGGNNNVVAFNEIENTGYIPITFNGNNVLIKNNYINHFVFVKDDGGGIYSWNGTPDAPVFVNRKVTGNVVLNGKGSGEGTDNPSHLQAYGIYLDDVVKNVEVSNNTVANCAKGGLFIHNASDNIIANNTFYNNQTQLIMSHDNVSPNSPVANITLTGNIFFSLTENQLVADFQTKNDDLPSFGNFDHNIYSRPSDENAIINTFRIVNGIGIGKLVDLEGWKALSGKDLNSKKIPRNFPAYTINQLVGLNKINNGNFTHTINNVGYFTPLNNSSISWASNSPLDGGALKVNFTSNSGTARRSSIIIDIGPVIANIPYIVRFSMIGSNENKSIEAFLRKSASPFNDLTDRKYRYISTNRSENEILLIPSVSESNASLVFDVEEQKDPLYLDNIILQEASIKITDPDDYIFFDSNASGSAKTIFLNEAYVDVKNKYYKGNTQIAPFSSLLLFKAGSQESLPPFSYLEFKGNKINDKVDLMWSTVNEVNTKHFEIENSINGIDFIKIGTVNAANSFDISHYQFSDAKPFSTNHYRLKLVSSNGEPTYSDIIKINFPESFSMVLTPNPVKSTLYINIASPLTGSQKNLSIQTVTGVRVKTIILSAANSILPVDVSGWSKGVYIVTLHTSEGKIAQKKFIKY